MNTRIRPLLRHGRDKETADRRLSYGLLRYSTSNLGDDIQSLAARQFLPRVDSWADRDCLAQWHGRSRLIAILNGWWSHNPQTWPPPPGVIPLLISMHVTSQPSVIQSFTRASLRKFYAQYGPVGCRDLATLSMFNRAGIDAYFSGCLTLTFPRNSTQRSRRILFVDIFGDSNATMYTSNNLRWLQSIPSDIREQLEFRTHCIAGSTSYLQRQVIASQRLSEYAEASLVVTGRIHCALPCAAFGTPVILVKPRHTQGRLWGLEKLFPIMAEVREVLRGEWGIDWTSIPEPNATAVDRFRTSLMSQCSHFINAHVEH